MTYSFVTNPVIIESAFLGNTELFDECITKFATQYRDAGVILQHLCNTNHHDDGIRYLHSLKGTALILGIEQLYCLIRTLEAIILLGNIPLDDAVNQIVAYIDAIVCEIDVVQSTT